MNTLEYKSFYKRNLPHIQPPGATLFITFRLTGSIPKKVLQQLAEETKHIQYTLNKISDPHERNKQAYLEQRRLFGKWDKALDSNPNGPYWLQNNQIASLVDNSIHHRNTKVYNLDAFCIMPNHVHLIYTPLPKKDGEYYAMSAIMHSLKLYTANQCNQILKREGAFWQHENYDHVVRNEKELNRIITYVINNPVKAGLVNHWKDWKWTYCKYSL